MSKIYGLFGAMKGKVADVVMSVRNGEQIVRKYQPVVYNPSTPAQIESRAKMKLMSQLSAVMAPVVAMRRKGPVSSRNLFVKKNYALTSFNNDEASVNLPMVQLTNSVVALPDVSVSTSGQSITLSLNGTVDLDKVVYVMLLRQADGKLRLRATYTTDTPGSGVVTDVAPGFDGVVYAYGIRYNTTAARTIFGDLTAPTAEVIAKLIVSNTLLESDITLTETKGVNVTPNA